MIYGDDQLLDNRGELLVVPRLCELCWEHPAVYYECVWWPASYLCRPCMGPHLHALAEAVAIISPSTLTESPLLLQYLRGEA